MLRCPRCGTIFEPPARFCTKDGFPLTADPSPSISGKFWGLHRTSDVKAMRKTVDPASGLSGRILESRYEIEDRVGEGGMAYVYRARDLVTQATVAVKVLMSRLANDAESVARLRREATLAMKLHHPNVCSIIALGDTGGMPFLVMPYLEGETLATRESRVGPMPVVDAVPILIQLCRGLQHAHEHGVLHRDLKPENVMLVPGERERTVVMDFGLAKEQITGAERERLTATGIVLGTPEFMSPEQIRGHALDYRSDMYALGVLAFELLTTELPFDGGTAQETMLNHLQGRPRKLRAARPTLPVALEAVIDRSLALEPANRFASMAEFAEALALVPRG